LWWCAFRVSQRQLDDCSVLQITRTCVRPCDDRMCKKRWMSACTRTHARTRAHTHAQENTHMRTHTHTHTCTRTHTHMHTHTHTHTHTRADFRQVHRLLRGSGLQRQNPWPSVWRPVSTGEVKSRSKSLRWRSPACIKKRLSTSAHTSQSPTQKKKTNEDLAGCQPCNPACYQ